VTARYGVAGEQHTRFGKVEGDAAGGVAGDGDGPRATAEVQHVAVVELVVDVDRRGRGGRHLGAGLL
jgi:hypothetical protein